MSEQDDRKPTIKTGKVSGDIVNIGGEQTFHGDVSINHGVLSNAPSDPARENLKELLQQLEDALKDAPEDQAEDIVAVQQIANTAAEEASKEKPNKTMLTVTGEGLKQAAQNLLAVSPIAVKIAAVLLHIPT